jgi:tetratricopeptide (TPR) repeat protein
LTGNRDVYTIDGEAHRPARYKRENVSPRRPGKIPIVLSIAIIAGVLLASYWPCLNNGFTNWDDDKYVTDNPVIKSISWENLKVIFSTFYIGAYTPVPLLAFMVECRISGPSPLLYHLINLLFHFANCILVFALALYLCKNIKAALAIALLFGIHPLKVESVAWITERKDVMYAFFYLAAIGLYIIYTRRQSVLYYGLMILAFLLSLGSKPAAMTLPFVLLLYDHYRENRITPHAWLNKIPLAAVAIVFGIIATIGQHTLARTRVWSMQSLLELPGVVGRELIFYLGKIFLPLKLSCLYPLIASCKTFLPNAATGLGIAALVILVYLLFRYNRRIAYGVIFFIITILPALSIVRQGLPVADRFMYMPILGIILSLAAVCQYFGQRSIVKQPVLTRSLAIAALVVVTGLFGIMTNSRCRVWYSSLTLWNDALSKYPDLSIAYTNRGKYYLDVTQFRSALADFNKAITLDPHNALAFYNRGHANYYLGSYDSAIKDFTNALDLDSNYARAYDSRGMVYTVTGNFDGALADLNRAIAIFPRFAGAYNNRGLLYYDQRKFELALADFNRAITLSPDYLAAYNNRGMLYFDQGKYVLSIADFTSALKLVPQCAEAFYNRGLVYQTRGDLALALTDLSRAIYYNPSYGEAYHLRAYVFYQTGDIMSAWHDVEMMRRIGFEVDPRFIDLLNRQYSK